MEEGRIHKNVEPDREETMSFRQVAFHRVLMSQTEAQEADTNETLNDPIGLSIDVRDGDINMRQSFTAMNLSSHSLASIFESDSEEDEESEEDASVTGRTVVSRFSLARCESVTSLSDTEICSDAGAKVYFERSGPRRWNMPPFQYANSSMPEAIALILDYLQPEKHNDQNGTINTGSNITINDQLLIRVNKTLDNQGVSEPTPEGIHQDATEISSVTLIGRKNVARGRGCESRIWKLDQPIGNYDSQAFGELDENSDLPVLEGFSWDNCLFNGALDSPWETIIFNDRKVKHEVRGFYPEDESKPSYRDVIVNFLRKPLSNGMDEHMVDGKIESIV
eukprot:scaffold18653_cov142-Skeletonema_dohrnii-CCMP3373.AAC.2